MREDLSLFPAPIPSVDPSGPCKLQPKIEGVFSFSISISYFFFLGERGGGRDIGVENEPFEFNFFLCNEKKKKKTSFF